MVTKFDITKFVITKFDITTLAITKLVIIELVIKKFDVKNANSPVRFVICLVSASKEYDKNCAKPILVKLNKN